MNRLTRRGRILLRVLGAVLLLLGLMQVHGPSPTLIPVASAALWQPASYAVGVAAVSSPHKPSPQRMPPNAGTLSTYVDGAQLKSLPYFEAGVTGEPLRTLAYSVNLTEPLSALGLSRFNATTLAHTPEYGVLFMQVINGGDIFLNGTWVQGIPRSDAMTRRVWYQPLLVPLPSRLLHHDGADNVLTVVQTTYEPYLLVPKLFAGRIDDLTLVSAVALFLSSTLANTSNLFCLIAGIFMIGAWVASPKDKVFGLAGAASILWAVLFCLALWPVMPVQLYETWRLVIYICEAGVMTLMSLFVLAFAQCPLSRRGNWIVWLYASIAPVVYLVGGRATENALDQYWTLPPVLFYVYACGRLALHAFRTSSLPALALLFQSLVCAALALHDYAVLTGVVDTVFPRGNQWHWMHLLSEPIYLTHLGLPLLLLVMGYVLLAEYRTKVQQVREANTALQSALAVREAELQKSYEAHRRLVRQDAERQERDRIYHDVHDGIGSRLVSLLFMLRSGTSAPEGAIKQVESCIADLRAVINAHVDDNLDVQSSVFETCINLETQLEGSSVRLSYDIDDGAPIVLARPMHLHVVRACQEMLTNAIKHSGASQVEVRLQQLADTFCLRVADNGRGLLTQHAEEVGSATPQARQRGVGLRGLQVRAQALGGRCLFSTTAGGGLTVSLEVPLPSSQGRRDPDASQRSSALA